MPGKAAAVIVAGGQGTRFGASRPKQYLPLLGRPILRWSLDAFDGSPSIGQIILAVPPSEQQRTGRLISQWKLRKPLKIVVGGATRADSVRNGLAAVSLAFQWIVVHDAVRPLVTSDLIESVLAAARRYQAAIAACPSRDTVKIAGKRETIDRTIPRDQVWLAQTPQAFARGLLEKAHRRPRSTVPTDDAELVESLGIAVKLVASTAENLKVTVPADLQWAETWLRRNRNRQRGL